MKILVASRPRYLQNNCYQNERIRSRSPNYAASKQCSTSACDRIAISGSTPPQPVWKMFVLVSADNKFYSALITCTEFNCEQEWLLFEHTQVAVCLHRTRSQKFRDVFRLADAVSSNAEIFPSFNYSDFLLMNILGQNYIDETLKWNYKCWEKRSGDIPNASFVLLRLKSRSISKN